MGIDELTFRLLVLFFPGLICNLLVTRYTSGEHGAGFLFFIRSFVFGLCAYVVFYAGEYLWVSLPWTEHGAAGSGIIGRLSEGPVRLHELAIVTLLALVEALLLILNSSKRWLTRFLDHLNLIDGLDEEEVWEFALRANRELAGAEGRESWVRVHDLKLDLLYEGWADVFSRRRTRSAVRELILHDVRVFDRASGQLRQRLDYPLYVARKNDEIMIELMDSRLDPLLSREAT